MGTRNNYLNRILIFLVALISYFLLVTGGTYAYLYLEDKNSNITGKREFEKEYFDNQGTVVTDGKVRVEENGYYTFYVSDKKGNVSISTILIKNIEK